MFPRCKWQNSCERCCNQKYYIFWQRRKSLSLSIDAFYIYAPALMRWCTWRRDKCLIRNCRCGRSSQPRSILVPTHTAFRSLVLVQRLATPEKSPIAHSSTHQPHTCTCSEIFYNRTKQCEIPTLWCIYMRCCWILAWK